MKFTKMCSPAFLAILSLAIMAESAFATQGNPSNPLPLIVQQRLNQSALAGPLVRLGTQVTQKKVNVLKAVYDYAILGGTSGSTGATGASHILKDSDGGDATLPKDALVKSVMVRVPTTLTSAISGAAIQCGINANANDLVSPTQVSTLNSGNRMTAGAIVQGTVSGWLKVIDYNQAVGCLIMGAPITAGKYVLYIEYYIGYPNE
jgi:hypothetical protein